MTQPDKSKQGEQGFDIDESIGMDQEQQALFLNIRKSKSDDSFLGKLMLHKSQMEHRPLILTIPSHSSENQMPMAGFKVFRKIKKQRKKNLSDYRKNICGYITKKIIREFVSPNYSNYVNRLCENHQCDYATLKSYYLSRIQRITGPSHIPGLLIPQDQDEVKIKAVFKEFFQWFLNQRYLRYLLNEGKMSDKKAYIQYKNNILIGMLNEAKQACAKSKYQKIKQQPSSSSQEEQVSQSQQKNESKPKIIIKKEQTVKEKQRFIPKIPIAQKYSGQQLPENQ